MAELSGHVMLTPHHVTHPRQIDPSGRPGPIRFRVRGSVQTNSIQCRKSFLAR